MSRGADDIVRECLMRLGLHHKYHSQAWVAETIVEAIEAEEFLAVPKECLVTYAPDIALELELERRRNGAVNRGT